MKYRFYKEVFEDGMSQWFIDLKRFPFNKAWLAMVAGADEVLDNLAKGKNEITLEVKTSPIPYSDGVLERVHRLGLFKGATYIEKSGFNNPDRKLIDEVWLCPVTVWVFWKYPKKIWFKIVE